jgi:formylmethanofuran dehydrogenase subunit C
MNISWRLDVSGDFATASNWVPAVVPGPADDVTIGVKGTYTVTSSISETVDSLSILDSGATLLITGASNFFSTNNGVNKGTIIIDGDAGLNFSNAGAGPGSFINSGKLEATNGTFSPLAGR